MNLQAVIFSYYKVFSNHILLSCVFGKKITLKAYVFSALVKLDRGLSDVLGQCLPDLSVVLAHITLFKI